MSKWYSKQRLIKKLEVRNIDITFYTGCRQRHFHCQVKIAKNNSNDIYNADEAVLFYSTLSLSQGKRIGGKPDNNFILRQHDQSKIKIACHKRLELEELKILLLPDIVQLHSKSVELNNIYSTFEISGIVDGNAIYEQ